MIETDHNKYYELSIYCIWISYWIEILTSAKIHLTLIENYIATNIKCRVMIINSSDTKC